MNKTRHLLKTNTYRGSALDAIYNQMSDGGWYSLKELAFVAGITEAGASARIRDLRKPRFGGHTIYTQPAYGDVPWLYSLDTDWS